MQFTVDFSKGMTLSLAPETYLDEVKQSLYILVNTFRGETPCYREFGVNADYLHKPVTIARAMYAATVTDAIERFLPQVQVKRVKFDEDAETPEALMPILEVVVNEPRG